jgi:hypothetical protein
VATFLKDIGWLVLVAVLLPLGMALTVVGVTILVGRSLYLWARGNTTSTSRVSSRHAWPGVTWWSSARAWSRRWSGESAWGPPSQTPVLVPAYATARARRR